LNKDVLEWLNTKSDKLIHIYGARDYWTAGAVTPNNNIGSEWFFVKDKDHIKDSYNKLG